MTAVGDARVPQWPGIDWAVVPALDRPVPFRPLPVVHGRPAVDPVTRGHAGARLALVWDCECDRSKIGLGPRHLVRYWPQASGFAVDSAGVAVPVMFEARTAAMVESPLPRVRPDGSVPERGPAIPCSSARQVLAAPPELFSRARGVTRVDPGPQIAAQGPDEVEPAGRIGDPFEVWPADLPLRCTARQLAPSARMPMTGVRGRRLPGGPIVTRVRLEALNGSWSAIWSGPEADPTGALSFNEANVLPADGPPAVPVNFNELRKIVLHGATHDGVALVTEA